MFFHLQFGIEKILREIVIFFRKKEQYQCNVCEREFAYAVNLKKHFWFCHSTTGAQLKMLNSQGLRLPIPLPSKEEKLNEKYEDMKCSLCGKICKNWKSLELHMLSHANEKPFKCELCGKGFKVIFQTTIFSLRQSE